MDWEWNCQRCDQDRPLASFLRGTCMHDICRGCIAEEAMRELSRSSRIMKAPPSLVPCPVLDCAGGFLNADPTAEGLPDNCTAAAIAAQAASAQGGGMMSSFLAELTAKTDALLRSLHANIANRRMETNALLTAIGKIHQIIAPSSSSGNPVLRTGDKIVLRWETEGPMRLRVGDVVQELAAIAAVVIEVNEEEKTASLVVVRRGEESNE